MRRKLAWAALIAALALGAAAAIRPLLTPAPPAPPAPAPPTPGEDAGRQRPRPAGPAERALVAPLAEGSALDDYEVREIHAVGPEGAMQVVCAKGRSVVRLSVALLTPATEEGPEPPAVAGRYAIFYSLRGASPEEGERLARALAEVLSKNDAAPAPPGMAPFAPPPRPPTPI